MNAMIYEDDAASYHRVVKIWRFDNEMDGIILCSSVEDSEDDHWNPPLINNIKINVASKSRIGKGKAGIGQVEETGEVR